MPLPRKTGRVMSGEGTENAIKLHPVQLLDIGVRELYIRSNVVPSITVGAEPQECTIKVSKSFYSQKRKRVVVSLMLEVGTDQDESKAPYSMRIELTGIFEVKGTEFTAEQVTDWANRGAPYVLFPYLREHAYGLSARCGFMPLILPLVEVPTFKVEKPKGSRKKTA